MGKPVTIALTARDLMRLAYNESQSFLCADGSADDMYQLMLTLDRQFMGGMANYSGNHKMGASLVRTGPGLPQMQWDVIKRLQTNSLVAVPSFLLSMVEWAKTNSVDVNATSVVKAICIGESIRKEDFSLSALGEKLAKDWSIHLYSTYAATELQTAFTECGAGRGGHHQPDLVIVEIVDDEGQPMPDGTPGEVVITTLGIEGMPLLRYRTGDIAALHAEPCSCGRHSWRLGPVIGRLGLVIKYKGTTLYPAAIFDVLAEVPYVGASIVEVITGALGTDEVRLHLFSKVNAEECESRLRPLLQSRLRVAPQLVFHTAEGLQAMQMPVGNRKPVRFIDNR
jgi:phenylacetate-CoA ligase